MYPDFIGIGAQKAGTTWLYRNMQTHPQIHMPRKEVHYFDQKMDDRSNALTRLLGKRQSDTQWRQEIKNLMVMHLKKQPSLQNLLWDVKYHMPPQNDRWYASVFEPKKAKISGEITPAYSAIEYEKVAHVHQIMPHTKIIFFMRNPIERVWSQTVMSFDKAGKEDISAVSERGLLRRIERNSAQVLSNYRRTLENWSSFYPESQIFVGFLEDVHFFPEELLGALYEFLGVDPHFDTSLMGEKIHSRSTATMPTKIAIHLARNYHEEIVWLRERFGGYASFWLYCAERLIENPPENEAMPYPLWGSRLWEEWTSKAGTIQQPRSGLLISARVAG